MPVPWCLTIVPWCLATVSQPIPSVPKVFPYYKLLIETLGCFLSFWVHFMSVLWCLSQLSHGVSQLSFKHPMVSHSHCMVSYDYLVVSCQSNLLTGILGVCFYFPWMHLLTESKILVMFLCHISHIAYNCDILYKLELFPED